MAGAGFPFPPSPIRRAHRSLVKPTFGSDRGSIIVGSLIGIIVAAITITAFATTMRAAASATASSAMATARSSLVNTVSNDLATQPLTVPTTPTRQEPFGGGTTDVTVWRTVDGAGSATIHAATPISAGADCAQPGADCASAAITVPIGRPGIAPTVLPGSWADSGAATAAGQDFPPDSVVGTAGIPASSAAEVRYIVRVAAPAATTLEFRDGATVLLAVPVAAGADQYFYGSLDPDGAAVVTIALSGPAATLSRLYLYEAPA